MELEDDDVETPTLETWPSLTWMDTRDVILTEKTEKGMEGREINGFSHLSECYIRSHISVKNRHQPYFLTLDFTTMKFSNMTTFGVFLAFTTLVLAAPSGTFALARG